MRASWLSMFLLGACGAALRPAPPTVPVPIPAQARQTYAAALATFSRLDAGTWDGAACREALAAFEQANADAGGHLAAALYMSGRVASRCGNEPGAHDFYSRALEIDDALCEPRVALGLSALERGDTARARNLFEEAVARDARCAPAYVDLAILQSEAEPELALANLRRALAARADYLPALDQMALLYLAQAEGGHRELLDLAEMVCRQAQIVDASWAPLYNTWALIDLERGDLTAAAAKLGRATALDPDFFEAQMNLGELLLSQRAYEDARAAFTRARTLRAQSYDAALGLGVALRGLNRATDAEASYIAAVDLDRARPEAYYDLGVLYMDHRDGTEEQLTRARAYFQSFLEHARAYGELASAIEDVERQCAPPRGRRPRSSCRPGRLQLIEASLHLMAPR